MPEQKRIPVEKIKRDPAQPRREFKEAVIAGLAENLRAVGQLVPIIVYPEGDSYVCVDGESRLRACILANLAELDAVVLQDKPTPEALAVARASIDVHRTCLSPCERSDHLARLQRLTGWTVTELASKVCISQATASKLLSLQKLSPDVRVKVAAGEIDVEKAAIIAAQPDPATQAALLAQAPTLTRGQLRQKAKPPRPQAQERATLARFPLAAGLVVTVQGREVTLEGAIDALADALKELRRGLAQGVGIDSMQKVMRDKARATA